MEIFRNRPEWYLGDVSVAAFVLLASKRLEKRDITREYGLHMTTILSKFKVE
jgi:hypothetical protein